MEYSKVVFFVAVVYHVDRNCRFTVDTQLTKSQRSKSRDKPSIYSQHPFSINTSLYFALCF
jgi:hypothetical protein